MMSSAVLGCMGLSSVDRRKLGMGETVGVETTEIKWCGLFALRGVKGLGLARRAWLFG